MGGKLDPVFQIPRGVFVGACRDFLQGEIHGQGKGSQDHQGQDEDDPKG